MPRPASHLVWELYHEELEYEFSLLIQSLYFRLIEQDQLLSQVQNLEMQDRMLVLPRILLEEIVKQSLSTFGVSILKTQKKEIKIMHIRQYQLEKCFEIILNAGVYATWYDTIFAFNLIPKLLLSQSGKMILICSIWSD